MAECRADDCEVYLAAGAGACVASASDYACSEACRSVDSEYVASGYGGAAHESVECSEASAAACDDLYAVDDAMSDGEADAAGDAVFVWVLETVSYVA